MNKREERRFKQLVSYASKVLATPNRIRLRKLTIKAFDRCTVFSITISLFNLPHSDEKEKGFCPEKEISSLLNLFWNAVLIDLYVIFMS